MEEITVNGREAVPVMSDTHNKEHGGKMFRVHTSNGALGASAALLIEIIIPTGYEMHLKSISYYTATDGKFEFLENVTLTTGVTPLTPRNRRRRNPKKSVMTFKSNPTGISGGTDLDTMYTAGGSQSSGIVRSNDDEWIMAPGTHLIRLTNLDTVPRPADVSLNYYEYKEA